MNGSTRPSGRRVVLAGAGHAQLYTLKHAIEFARRGHELVTIAPDHFWYSGLATGVLSGLYTPAIDKVDVEALTRQAGGRFIRDRITEVDLTRRLVHLERGDPLSFDALSITLGSEPHPVPGAGGVPGCYSVKPIAQICRLREEIERRLTADPSSAPRIVVAGGGVTAVELASNLEALARRFGGNVRVVVLAGRGGPLRQLPPAAASLVLDILERRGICVQSGARVERVEPGCAILEGSGTAVAFDLFVNATGLQPNPVLKRSGLPVDGRGAMLVDDTLRSIADPNVHGGGDCIAIRGYELPRIGVHAIREAPILFRNLLAALDCEPAETYAPQARYLWIMNLGDETGLAVRGGLWWHGRLAFRLKDWIDRRFLREYQIAAGSDIVA
ncbi:NAD(P)/FAD-dependent oxidoreductase [Indioceanicola profundi]|uniref:NAD(P)/FAD-dependent oxidoreductase n=1 Tax=Indioceanicola profundi TaxID=2220096 RepID=UPI000E6AD7DE|nr:FAD-dependent oxidoreductase [Indioceanicola profundi]